MQTITSAATCIRHRSVPALFKINGITDWKPGQWNLDMGGGKYDDVTEALAKRGIDNVVIDPYNRSDYHNQLALEMLQSRPADTATLSNVLNVIQHREDRIAVLRKVKELVKPGGLIYISCYRGKGDKPGPTKYGWQENRNTYTYRDEVMEVFGGLSSFSTSIIIARNI